MGSCRNNNTKNKGQQKQQTQQGIITLELHVGSSRKNNTKNKGQQKQKQQNHHQQQKQQGIITLEPHGGSCHKPQREHFCIAVVALSGIAEIFDIIINVQISIFLLLKYLTSL